MGEAITSARRPLAAIVTLALTLALVVIPALDAAADAFDIRVAPGIQANRAVRVEQPLAVSGTAPSGQITAAQVLAIEVDGTIRTQTVPSSALNRGPAGALEQPRDYLQNENGQLSGRITLGCLFVAPAPSTTCPHGEVRQAAIVIRVGDQTSTLDQVNRVRVDYRNPLVRGYEVIAPDRIRMVFSEPVRPPTGGDLPTDWRVEQPARNVIRVEGPTENDCVGRYLPGEDPTAGPTGCTRTLVLDLPIDEDVTPFVRYTAEHGRQVRNTYEDFASNITFLTTPGVRSYAIDRIRPPLPRIISIDGKPPSDQETRVTSNEPAPAIRVDNLRAGHQLQFQVVRPSGAVSASAWTDIAAEEQTFDLFRLTGSTSGDGLYEVHAIVRDANGNLSTDTSMNPARADSGPSVVGYLLDQVPPLILSAVQRAPREILVTFSEPVLPSGSAGRWTVDGQPATATQPDGVPGDQRVLTTAHDVTDASVVAWEPTDSGYHDAAGNALAARTLPVSPLPVLPVPVVTVPSGEVYTAQSSITVRGTTAAQGSTLVVEIFDAGQDTPRATVDVAGGAWSADLTLATDRRYQLEARVRDTVSGARSPRVGFPHIVRDTAAPAVDVRAPTSKGLLEDLGNPDRRRQVGIGEAVTVQWQATDDARPGDTLNPDHGDVVDIDLRFFSQDGDEGTPSGSRRVAGGLPHTPGETRSHSYTVREDDLGGPEVDQRRADFAVAVTDLAGNVGADASAQVLIIRNLIGYVPVLVSNELTGAVVEARFPRVMEVPPVVPPESFCVRMQSGDEMPSPEDACSNGLPVTPGRNRTEPHPETGEPRTILELNLPPLLGPGGTPDPNARFTVQYRRPPAHDIRIRSGAIQVTENVLLRTDAIPPALNLVAPSAQPRNLQPDLTVTISGTTDRTAHPNTIAVHRVDAQGNRLDGPSAQALAGQNGEYSMAVPVDPNTTNRFEVEAVDPGGNRSLPRAFTVIEDSIPPHVTVTSPAPNTQIQRPIQIRWTTADANPQLVDIEHRRDGGPWQFMAQGIPDEGFFDWDPPMDLRDDEVIDIRVSGIDAAANRGGAVVPGLRAVLPTTPPGNGGPGGGGLPAPITRAVATAERTVELHFTEAVAADDAPAGFSIVAGPGVSGVEGGGGQVVTLRLNTDLSTTTPTVSYNGAGLRRASDGAPYAPFRIQAERGFVFAPDGLAGVGLAGGAIRISWVDDRNVLEHVVGYEVRRGGAVIATLPRDARGYVDAAAGGVAQTYEMRAIDDLGHVSRAAVITVDPNAPNITPRGGFVLAEDGGAAVIVPPNAVTRDYFGRLVALTGAAAPDYDRVGSGYELVGEAADDGSPLPRLARYSAFSFRPGPAALDGQIRERLSVVRLTPAPAPGAADEVATRTGRGSAETAFLTPGAFMLGQARGATVRVFGPDPGLARDRFATASGLSQMAHQHADAAVIARADDYPDALAAAALAEHLGGPLLLAPSNSLPRATELELLRLGVRRAVLVGGTVALDASVEAALQGLGLQVERVAGPTRYDTAIAVARRVGTPGGTAYLATGQNFADALAGSAGSAHLGRPILLSARGVLPNETIAGLSALGIRHLDILGGGAAISPEVEAALVARGITTRRIAGSDRFGTAVAVAQDLSGQGLGMTRPIAANGQGVGRTSPDALAAGPVAARLGSSLMLVPRDVLHSAPQTALRESAEVRGVVVAGGRVAVTDRTRAQIDATRR